jgi:hypothetical protein
MFTRVEVSGGMGSESMESARGGDPMRF